MYTKSIIKKLALYIVLPVVLHATVYAAEEESAMQVFEPANEQQFIELCQKQVWSEQKIYWALLSVYFDALDELLNHRNSQVDSNKKNSDNVQQNINKPVHEDVIKILKNRDIKLKLKNAKGTKDILVLRKKLDAITLLSKNKHLGMLINNGGGNSLLNFAATNGRFDLVKRLVPLLPEEIDARNAQGLSPLHIAAKFGELATLKFLLSAGVNRYARDKEGHSVLHHASARGKLDIVEFLVIHSLVPIDAQNNAGHTPLHLAAKYGQLNALKFLLDSGVNNDTRDNYGNSVLHYASARSKLDIVEFLVSHCAVPIEAQNNMGQTPLHLAAEHGQLNILKFLLDSGANKDARDNTGRSILYHAASTNKLTVVRFLITQNISPIQDQNGAGISVLHIAAHRALATLQFLLEAGSNSAVRDGTGNSILHHAAGGGQLPVVQFLVTRNIFAIEVKNSLGQTPLHLAAGKGLLTTLQFLLEAGANIDALSNHGNSVLHHAAGEGQCAILEYLLKNHRLDIEKTNNNNHTPLELAIRCKTLETTCILLRAGAQYGQQHIQQIVQHGNFKDSIWNFLPHIFSLPAEKQFQWHLALHKRALKKINNTYNWIATPEGRAYILISLLPSMNQQPIPYFKKARALLSQRLPQDLVKELCEFSAIPWRNVDKESHGNKRSHDDNEDVVSPASTKKQRVE